VSLSGLTRNSEFGFLAQGLWEGVTMSSRYIVPGPESYGGAWDRRTGP